MLNFAFTMRVPVRIKKLFRINFFQQSKLSLPMLDFSLHQHFVRESHVHSILHFYPLHLMSYFSSQVRFVCNHHIALSNSMELHGG